MLVREYGQCVICKTKMILRVGIGLERSCQHSFDCPHCHTPIAVDAKTGEPPEAWIEMVENIERIEQDNDAKVVVNLHPSFAFQLSDYHSPYAFASMQASELIKDHVRVPASARLRDVALHFEVPHTSQLWPLVKSTVTLVQSGDPAGVLGQQLSRYEALRREFKPEFKCETAFKCVASFFDDIFYPAIGKLRSPLRAYVRKQLHANQNEFERFRSFFSREFEQESVARFLSTFSDYFLAFDQFRQVLIHARVADEGVDDLIVGSKNFDRIKLYYGQAYESLTSEYAFLAGLFNISQGRPFDQFARMSLRKYMTDVDKAKRSNPFSSEPELFAFAAFEDSALRNGSHHASIWREGELVRFRSGGAGTQRELPFSRYLHTCNLITIALAALFLVEQEFVGVLRPS